MGNEVAVNVLGTIGTVLWCVQLVPQVIRNFIKKNCEGLPPLMMFLWAASGIPFSIYFIGSEGSIPLQIQPQLFTFFSLLTWAQSLYYPPFQMQKIKVLVLVTTFVLIAVGLEVGFIVWLKPVYEHGTHWPMLVFGIIASVLLALGLIPPYFELGKRKGRVVGINFFFLGMDTAGAIFSLISIVVGTVDAMSMALYIIVIALETGIYISQTIWYLLYGRKILKEEKREEQIQKQKEQEEMGDISINDKSDQNTTVK